MNRLITFEKDNQYITEKFTDLDAFREKYPFERIVKIKYSYDHSKFDDTFIPIPECEGYAVNLFKDQVLNTEYNRLCDRKTNNGGRTFYYNVKRNGKHTAVSMKFILKSLGKL